jgi:hypothetical protein
MWTATVDGDDRPLTVGKYFEYTFAKVNSGGTLMNAGKYTLRIIVAVSAFFIGYSAYAGTTRLLAYFGPKEMRHRSSVHVPMPVTADPCTSIKYGASGHYYLFDQALKRGFPDLDNIEIKTEDANGDPIPPLGSVRAKRKHNFVSISITDDLVSFETESVRGTSYIFNGRFESPADDSSHSFPVLRGSLFKLEKGKIVATINTSLYPEGS